MNLSALRSLLHAAVFLVARAGDQMELCKKIVEADVKYPNHVKDVGGGA